MQSASASSGPIDRAGWNEFLPDFSRRNANRPTRLDVVSLDAGAQELEKHLPLEGVSMPPEKSADGSVAILLGGESPDGKRHMEHIVLNVKLIVPIAGTHAFEDGLALESEDGTRTILTFEDLRELPEH